MITHIELDLTIYMKAKIKIFEGDRLVKLIEPKWDKKDDVFNKVNEAWYKEIKKQYKENKDVDRA